MRARLVIPFVGAIAQARAAHAVAAPGLAPAGGLSALRDALLAGAPLDAPVRRARGFERIPSAFNDPVGDGDGDQAPDITTVTDACRTIDDRSSAGAGDDGLRDRVSAVPGPTGRASSASTSRGSLGRCL